MRMSAVLAVAATTVVFASGELQAARWCHAGPNAKGCAYSTRAQCLRAARRIGGECRQQVARSAPAYVPATAPLYPTRPAWASPYECYYDEGYGRFRPCNAGDNVN